MDFAAPVGYQPPEPEKMNTDGEDAAMDVRKIISICYPRGLMEVSSIMPGRKRWADQRSSRED